MDVALHQCHKSQNLLELFEKFSCFFFGVFLSQLIKNIEQCNWLGSLVDSKCFEFWLETSLYTAYLILCEHIIAYKLFRAFFKHHQIKIVFFLLKRKTPCVHGMSIFIILIDSVDVNWFGPWNTMYGGHTIDHLIGLDSIKINTYVNLTR